jgi:hypothetical protein
LGALSLGHTEACKFEELTERFGNDEVRAWNKCTKLTGRRDAGKIVVVLLNMMILDRDASGVLSLGGMRKRAISTISRNGSTRMKCELGPNIGKYQRKGAVRRNVVRPSQRRFGFKKGTFEKDITSTL